MWVGVLLRPQFFFSYRWILPTFQFLTDARDCAFAVAYRDRWSGPLHIEHRALPNSDLLRRPTCKSYAKQLRRSLYTPSMKERMFEDLQHLSTFHCVG